jgi:hypothetical protein
MIWYWLYAVAAVWASLPAVTVPWPAGTPAVVWMLVCMNFLSYMVFLRD